MSWSASIKRYHIFDYKYVVYQIYLTVAENAEQHLSKSKKTTRKKNKKHSCNLLRKESGCSSLCSIYIYIWVILYSQATVPSPYLVDSSGCFNFLLANVATLQGTLRGDDRQFGGGTCWLKAHKVQLPASRAKLDRRWQKERNNQGPSTFFGPRTEGKFSQKHVCLAWLKSILLTSKVFHYAEH